VVANEVDLKFMKKMVVAIGEIFPKKEGGCCVVVAAEIREKRVCVRAYS
jgi:hypothetical protein